MAITIRQNSFAGGEISELLDGRIDLTRYLISSKLCRGFLVTKHGALLNRSGSVFKSRVYDSAKKSRLWAFKFGNDQNFLLEFADFKLRFFYNGGLVLSGGVPLVLDTPWAEADLPKLKFDQTRDVVTITCSGFDPMELRRRSNTDWSLALADFTAPASAWDATRTPAKTEMWLAYSPREFSADPKEYDYAISMLLKNTATGQVYETQASSFTISQACIKPSYPGGVGNWAAGTFYSPNMMVIGSDGALYICRVGTTGWDPTTVQPGGHYMLGPPWEQLVPPAWDVGTNYVSGARVVGPDGYLYFCTSVVNLGIDPSGPAGHMCWDLVRLGFSDLGRKTYLADSPIELNWPGLAAPADTQLVAYRLYRGVQHVDGSSVQSTLGLLLEQDPWITKFEDNGATPVDYTKAPRTGENPLAGASPETVCRFDQRRVFGRGSELILSETGDYYNLESPRSVLADSPTRLLADSGEYVEIRWMVAMRALLVGTNTHVPFVLTGSGGLGDPFAADSFSFRPHEKFGSAWLDPIVMKNQIIVLEDGSKSVRAVKYDVNSDGFESQDISVLSEHLLSDYGIIAWAFAQLPYSIIWGVRADGKLITITNFPEQEVVAWSWQDTQGNYEDVATVRENGLDAVYVIVNRGTDESPIRCIERFAPRPQKPVEGDWANWIYLDSSLVYSGAPATVFSGLDHLEGKEVMALADGFVLGPFTVAGGAINISEESPDGASVVVAGLAYTSKITTLGAVDKGRDIAGLRKKVLAVKLKLLCSRGFWVDAGQASREWRQRAVKNEYGTVPLFTGETMKILVPSDYNEHGSVSVEQRDPLPLSILNITREVDLGDG